MSAHATIAGIPVVDYRLTMPRAGVWFCEASLVDGRQPSGKVDLVIGSTSLKAFVQLATSAYDTTVVRLLGGAGGMGTTATPKHYSNATARLVLSDLLKTAGETLSADSDASVTSSQLSQWTVLEQPVGRQVKVLLAKLGADVTWRVLSDGTVWVGREKWPEVEPEHDLLQLNPLASSITISSDDALVLPGDKFLSSHVSRVEHSLIDGAIRSTIWTE